MAAAQPLLDALQAAHTRLDGDCVGREAAADTGLLSTAAVLAELLGPRCDKPPSGYIAGQGDKAAGDGPGASLSFSAMKGSTARLAALLAAPHALSPDAEEERNDFGWSPLMLAASYGHLACVDLLLAAADSPDEVDNTGCSALHLAARMGQAAAVTRLLRGRANASLANEQGKTAEQLIVKSGEGPNGEAVPNPEVLLVRLVLLVLFLVLLLMLLLLLQVVSAFESMRLTTAERQLREEEAYNQLSRSWFCCGPRINFDGTEAALPPHLAKAQAEAEAAEVRAENLSRIKAEAEARAAAAAASPARP